MINIIYKSKNQILYNANKDKHPYNKYDEINPYIAKEYIIKAKNENEMYINEDIDWNSNSGILIYGNYLDIENFFSELKKFLISELKDKNSDYNSENVELKIEGIPSHYCMFKSPTQNIGFIIGHGLYIDLIEKFKTYLSNQPKIEWITVDHETDPIGSLINESDGCEDNNNYALKIIKETIPHRIDCY